MLTHQEVQTIVFYIQSIHACFFQQRLFGYRVCYLGKELERDAVRAFAFQERTVVDLQIIAAVERIALAADVGFGFQTHFRTGHGLSVFAVEGEASVDVTRRRGETIAVIFGLHLFVGAFLGTFYQVFIHLARHSLGIGISIVHDTVQCLYGGNLHIRVLGSVGFAVFPTLHGEHIQRTGTFGYLPVQFHSVAEIAVRGVEIFQTGNLAVVQTFGSVFINNFAILIAFHIARFVSHGLEVVCGINVFLRLVVGFMPFCRLQAYFPAVEHTTLRNDDGFLTYQIFFIFGIDCICQKFAAIKPRLFV